jgi:hypothetical protein
LVDAILAAIANAPEDKLQQLRAAVSPIEPPALKTEVADAAKEETPEDGVAKITASLMKLDEAKLMELKSALEGVPKEGGDLLDEQQEFEKRQKERQAAQEARRAAAAKTAEAAPNIQRRPWSSGSESSPSASTWPFWAAM